MSITYEWVAEPTDEYDDIIDPIFGDTYKEVADVTIANFKDAVVVNYALVRNDGNDEQGLQERQYAYIVDGLLPMLFDDGAAVPTRYGINYNSI
jgi:hypothetical protein